ncbi:MAG TPA: phospholipase D-like domain-containing protein [Gemmatimonadales bacterium]|nr:phospholipase D-like domain-containing protein [Gemmatimonadales bacterium]
MPAGSAGISRALDRVTGSRPIPGNSLTLHADSARALNAMLALVGQAERWVHFENYIIRDDATGRRFADALSARAREGVRVRVLYDALGSWGTSAAFWHRLRKAGVDVRAFNPLFRGGPFHLVRRDHRKLVVVDGNRAMVGGLCIGDEWAGDPSRGRQPWRDTMIALRGPAAAGLDATFGRVWRRAGDPLPADEYNGSPAEAGPTALRIVEGVPDGARAWRAVGLLLTTSTERLWLTDAYLVAPATLFAGLLDAARDGVDVRILVPGATDIPVVRALTRIGYRDLLHAGVRLFEWRGPMLHAKTLVADRQLVRVGSSNINVSSLLANYELDVIVEDETLATEMCEQFQRDAAGSNEVVMVARRRLPPRITGAAAMEPAAAPHQPSRSERARNAVVALRQVAGGLRRRLGWAATTLAAGSGALLLQFPHVMSITLAVGAFGVAALSAWYSLSRRRRVRIADVP